jgi:colicin import membrane protein
VVRDNKNIIPVSMAIALHVALFASMFVAFDWSQPTPITPMAIRATLVPESAEQAPPRVVEKKPQPKPEPKPEPVVEAPKPEPDNSAELRREAEEKKRLEDAFIEKDRLEKIRQQEETERKRKEQEAADKKKAEDERRERERLAAERKRQEDIERQREENDRIRLELEAEGRQAEIDAEADRLAAVNSGEMEVYMAMIRQKVERNWSAPASAGAELECSVRVRQVPGGDVTGVTILSCNGDEAVQRSVKAAIYKSSPLPEPSNPSLFDRSILLNLSIRQ